MGGGEGNGSPTGTSCPRTDRHSTCQSLLWTFPLFESELQSLTSAAAAGALRGRGRPPEPPLFGAFPLSHVSEAFSESCGRPRSARGNIFWCVSHGGVERLDRAGAFGGGRIGGEPQVGVPAAPLAAPLQVTRKISWCLSHQTLGPGTL